MSMVRTLNRSLLGLCAVMLFMLVCDASSALALSPWWHLTSGARPTNIQSGRARDEVQEMAVSATEGEVLLIGSSGPVFAKWDADDLEMQEAFEGLYGKGNVEVTGGPGDETGSKPYVITFVGELADQPVELINATASLFTLHCDAGAGPDCEKEAIVTRRTKGRPDGQIVVTASNLGDANIDGETAPVTVTDKLPAGLKVVAVEGAADALGTTYSQPLGCVRATLSCTFTGILPPYEHMVMLISVVSDGGSSDETSEASVTGGEAASVSIKRPVAVG